MTAVWWGHQKTRHGEERRKAPRLEPRNGISGYA